MDYEQGYNNTVYLADQIMQSAQAGNSVKAGGGLASREKNKSITQDDATFNRVRADYMNMVRKDAAFSLDQSMADTETYIGMATTVPPRKPGGWDSAPLLDSLQVEVNDSEVQSILNTIKARESSGDYNVKNSKGSASGGYQFIDSTWQSLTGKYGIGTEYKSANKAPAAVQDAVAARYVKEILADNNGDITKVPVVWYTGNNAGTISKEALKVNNGLTPAEYQSKWMRAYNKLSGTP